MEILIISGFLGAGKTTFIKEMAKATGRDFVIVENEFSELDIDGEVLRKSEVNSLNNLKIEEISEGCICCSSKIDFSSTVVTIENTLSPDVLVVEPSGVAFLSNILENLKPVLYDRIGLLDPIVIIDGENYISSKNEFSDYFFNQLDNSKHIVVSKSENFSEDDFKNIYKNLNINPTEDMFTHYKNWNKKQWVRILSKKGKLVIQKNENIYDKDLETLGIKDVNIKSVDELIYILENFSMGKYGNIIRSKGFFATSAGNIRFDYVNGSYKIGDIGDITSPKFIVIGKNLKNQQIQKLIKNDLPS